MSAAAIWAIVARSRWVSRFSLSTSPSASSPSVHSRAQASASSEPRCGPLSSWRRRSHLQGSCSSDRSLCVTYVACPRGPEPESTHYRGSKAMR